MKTVASLFVVLLSINFNPTFSQEIENNNYDWTFSVNGGISFLLPVKFNNAGPKELFSYNTSLEKITAGISFNIDRSTFTLFLGKDKFFEDAVYSTTSSYKSVHGYNTHYFYGYGCNYTFLRLKNIDVYGGIDFLFNEDNNFLNFKAGIIKPILKHVSVNFAIRNTYDYIGTFDRLAGYQIGIDFGLMYHF